MSMSSGAKKNSPSRRRNFRRPPRRGSNYPMGPVSMSRPLAGVISRTEPKFFDQISLANSIGAGATIFPFSGVPQGVSQSQRVGDFIHVRALLLNYSLYIVNADIVTSVVIILFRWIPNTISLPPAVALLLQNPSSANCLSQYNFSNQQNYQILWQRQFRGSGIVTSPTTMSNFGQRGLRMPIRKGFDQEFAPGNVDGTNQLFWLCISDSSLTPFPILNFDSRIYYEDTIRAIPFRMI